MKLDNSDQNVASKLLEIIDFYRSIILDMVEQEIGTSPNWKFTRSRLLKALGDRGLAGRVREVLSTDEAKGGSHDR
ncbi:MAG: hypothetical protein A2X94_09125 [Bdellovibrionales bacterium GWB1_55_8]|nr:MAG: hypothetical protein A2X94_09125 [Bdellovibrionales bacterium GWB1_55_8]